MKERKKINGKNKRNKRKRQRELINERIKNEGKYEKKRRKS